MRLVDNARQFWRFWSVRLALLQSGVISLWFVYPFPSDQVDTAFKFIVFAINVLIMLSRLVKQEALEPGDIVVASKTVTQTVTASGGTETTVKEKVSG